MLLLSVMEGWVILHPLAVVHKQVMRYFSLPDELPQVMVREPTFINNITDRNFLINKSAQNLAAIESQQREELDDIIVFPL